MLRIYSLDGSIAEFFRHLCGITRRQCDKLAVSLAGAPVVPCPIQGAFSYTLYAGPNQDKVVQFRSEDLDIKMLELACSTFGHIVPTCAHHGYVGNADVSEQGQHLRLGVYAMDRVPGVTYIEARMRLGALSEIERDTWHKNVVMDFARFFALSWKSPIRLTHTQALACCKAIKSNLQLLLTSLPARFSGDLCEMNILVDPSLGHITGIIDWAEASV